MRKYLNLSVLLFLIGTIQASDTTFGSEKSWKGFEEYFKHSEKEAYKKYFEQQEQIYKSVLALRIPGVSRLEMDEVLAESVLADCPQEIKNAISRIEQNIFDTNQKNIMLHGISGTGKTSLAKAIAVKTKTPCLFFRAGSISTQFMNSGVQNLDMIFAHAKEIERNLDKPCIIIFDELESLTRKHAAKDNHENNILINFWQQLDNLNNNRVMVIGSMNNTEDLPSQMTTRTSMIEIPLPGLEKREKILSYYLQRKKDKYGVIYSEFATPAILAAQTKGFSNRDLKNLVDKASEESILASALPDRRNKMIMGYEFDSVIKQIKKDPKRRLEREIGTWKYNFKKNIRDPKIVMPAIGIIIAGTVGYKSISNQEKSIKQAKEIADKQMSEEQLEKQARINCSVMGIPVGLPFYYCKNGFEWVYSKFSK